MKMENKIVKVKYLHGRPAAHYTHSNFARNINADFEFIDFKYQWQDKKRNIFYIIFSWFYCAKNYTNRKLYDIFLVDGLHFSPVIMKYLFLKRKKQKIVVYLGSHTMYFLYAKKFSRLNFALHKWALNSYDVIICEGEMAKFFVTSILKKPRPLIYTVFNGIPAAQNFASTGREVKDGKKLLFIGSYDSQFRFDYKGIDIMLQAFDKAFESDSELTFTLVGRADQPLLNKELAKMKAGARKAVSLIDYTSNLEDLIYNHNIYLHCSRGDNFPTTVLIALSAGMPAIVNELNGTREVVARVNPALVTTQDPADIASRLLNYLALPAEEKNRIRQQATLVSKDYTEAKAVERFTTVFKEITSDVLKDN